MIRGPLEASGRSETFGSSLSLIEQITQLTLRGYSRNTRRMSGPLMSVAGSGGTGSSMIGCVDHEALYVTRRLRGAAFVRFMSEAWSAGHVDDVVTRLGICSQSEWFRF